MNPRITIHNEIGHILIVTYDGQPGFFWYNLLNKQSFGPFEFKSTAMEHWAMSHKVNKQLTFDKPKDNIIEVDFKTRRRYESNK